MLSKVNILVLLSISLGYSLIPAQSVNVPLNHWAYDYLDRLKTKGVVQSVLPGSKPYTRQDIANWLAEIDKNVQIGTVQLSHSEYALFRQLKGEFHFELDDMDVSSDRKWHERHLTRWSKGEHRIVSDLKAEQSIDIRSDDIDSQTRSLTTLGGSIRGQFGNRFTFYVSAKNTMIKGEEFTEEQFNPSQGMPVVLSGKQAYSDDALAVLSWHLPWLRMEFGRDRAHWGPGFRGGLLISQQNPRFDMLRINVNFIGFRFTSIHGKLNSELGDKYLAAHRLEFTLFPWLIIGGSESVVYGGRGVEPSYLNPLMPYHVAEHHQGDRDNNNMSLDFQIYPMTGHKIYTELYLDDFTTAENPFTYYGNKFALLAGWRWISPMGLTDSDLQLEYARIEPFVYTHKDSINVYKHYDRTIGHWLGPDSDDLILRWNHWFGRPIKAAIIAERIRHGEGRIDIPHTAKMGSRKEHLSGVVETRWLLGAEIRWQIVRDGFLTASYFYTKTSNYQNQKGVDIAGHQTLLHFSIDY